MGYSEIAIFSKMSIFKHIKLRSLPGGVLALCLFLTFSLTASAQVVRNQDTTETVVDTVAAEVAQADSLGNAEESTAAATVSTAGGGGASSTASASAAQAEEERGIDPQAYKNFFYGLLMIFLICVVIAIIGKVYSIYEMTSKLNGRYNPLAGNNLQATLLLIALPIFLYGVYWSYVNHGSMAYRAAVTEHGQRIDVMFIITTIITTFVLILIHILLFSFSYAYRMKPNKKAYFYPHNNAIEMVWTIVPAIVLTILVLFGFFTWRSITNVPEDLQKSAIQIEVLGEQFTWTVRYPGRDGVIGKRDYRMTTPLNPYGIDFTDNASLDDLLGGEIVIPVNQSVRFHIQSKDVLHSFYIPDFRVQINAVPGMTTYFQFTPTMTTQEMRDKMDDQTYDFVMLCNKICGNAHYNMQKRVRVVSEEEYQQWLTEQTFFFNEDVQKEFAANQTAFNNL